MGIIGQLQHIRNRRAELQQQIDVRNAFHEWEETCVPSYCHGNPLAAYVSWLRLFRSVELARRHLPVAGRALDFGSSVGELGRLLAEQGTDVRYEFIEQEEPAAVFLQQSLPEALRQTLETAPDGAYDWVFAIDSLEHNDDFAELLARIGEKLSPRGLLILSGPTENRLYRLGRAIAGFDSHYHKTTIYDIERAAATFLARRDVATIVPGAPLFRLSVWSRPEAS
ncbi:MAG: methyltransferase domain-containing protein [Kiloniellales bacterium]|nr:methyltransferase domain-containing protein [Kiloniellales bacterium]